MRDYVKVTGVYEADYSFDDEDDPIWIEDWVDLTDEWRRMTVKLENLEESNASLAKELGEIKSRRWWEEIEMVRDERSGQIAIVKTHYRMQMESMRLEVSPEMYGLAYGAGDFR